MPRELTCEDVGCECVNVQPSATRAQELLESTRAQAESLIADREKYKVAFQELGKLYGRSVTERTKLQAGVERGAEAEILLNAMAAVIRPLVLRHATGARLTKLMAQVEDFLEDASK